MLSNEVEEMTYKTDEVLWHNDFPLYCGNNRWLIDTYRVSLLVTCGV